jgi:outer membrane lipoprotein-sorting protein
MKTAFIFPAVLISLFPWAVPLHATEVPNVTEIVDRANKASYYAGDDGRSEVTMNIQDAQGRTRKREFVILRKDGQDGGDQKFYVYFKKPSDVRKMVFMVHKHTDKDDDRWMYLPALSLVKRIAASDKRTSFVGSDFYYEDVSGRGVDEDTHELLETTDDAFILNNTPKDPSSVEFTSYTIRIDRKTYLPVKAEYMGKDNRPYRIVEALEVKDFQGFPTVVKSRVRDLSTGSETVSEFKKVKYDIGLKDDIFTERYLRKPPREVRK